VRDIAMPQHRPDPAVFIQNAALDQRQGNHLLVRAAARRLDNGESIMTCSLPVRH